MSYRPEEAQLISTENIAAILSESGLEVIRLSPKIQKVRHIKNSFNARVTSFCFDPEGKRLAYFLSSKKFMVLDLNHDSDTPVQILKDVRDQAISIHWQTLHTQMDYNSNPFLVPIFEDDFTPDLTKKLDTVQ